MSSQKKSPYPYTVKIEITVSLYVTFFKSGTFCQNALEKSCIFENPEEWPYLKSKFLKFSRFFSMVWMKKVKKSVAFFKKSIFGLDSVFWSKSRVFVQKWPNRGPKFRRFRSKNLKHFFFDPKDSGLFLKKFKKSGTLKRCIQKSTFHSKIKITLGANVFKKSVKKTG